LILSAIVYCLINKIIDRERIRDKRNISRQNNAILRVLSRDYAYSIIRWLMQLPGPNLMFSPILDPFMIIASHMAHHIIDNGVLRYRCS